MCKTEAQVKSQEFSPLAPSSPPQGIQNENFTSNGHAVFKVSLLTFKIPLIQPWFKLFNRLSCL